MLFLIKFLHRFFITSNIRLRKSNDGGGTADHVVYVLMFMSRKIDHGRYTAIGAVWSGSDSATPHILEQVHIVEGVRGQDL